MAFPMSGQCAAALKLLPSLRGPNAGQWMKFADPGPPSSDGTKPPVPIGGSNQVGDRTSITENENAQQYPYSTTVQLDPFSVAVLRVDAVAGRSIGDTILAWIPPLHFGSFGGGAPVYVLWLLLGLSPAILGATGLLMW